MTNYVDVLTMPLEARVLIGSEMTVEARDSWWNTPAAAFNNRRPGEIWLEDKQRVIDFIESVIKSGGNKQWLFFYRY